MAVGFLNKPRQDLETPIEVRGFCTDWFSGLFSILLAFFDLRFVAAPRFPAWFGMPDLEILPPGYLAQLNYPFLCKPD